MNILHWVDEPYDSGIVHYALTAASGLQKRGHAVHVAGVQGAYPLNGAARLGLGTLATGRVPACLSCVRRFALNRKIDLINAHTGSSHALAVASTRFLENPPKIVRTRGGSRPVRRNPGASLIWKRTSGFIAAAGYILDQFRGAFPDFMARTQTIGPGIEDPCPQGAVPEPPAEGPLRIGVVARLDPVKGHAHFLKAAAEVLRAMPGTMFVLAGNEENVRATDLISIADKLGIRRSIEMAGRVPDPMEIMRRCHVGVVASTGSEAISRAAMEWMAAGRPLVATSVGCLPETVADGGTGFLVPPADPPAMARRIVEILKNPSMRRGMGGEARRRFLARFAMPRLIDETEQFYEAVLQAGGSPSGPARKAADAHGTPAWEKALEETKR